MHFLSVNFHYIEEEGLYPHPGIYPTPISRLKNQLIELGKIFKFISQEDLINAIDGKTSLPERSCLITFDDGLRCQYENAVPILDELRVPAVFFAAGMPFAEQRALAVHKIHWARSHIAPDVFLSLIAQEYKYVVGKDFDIEEFNISDKQSKQSYRYDTGADAKIKLVLNKFLKPDIRDKIVDRIFSAICINEASFCENFYMLSHQLKDLYKRGWLGAHSYSHPALATLDVKGVHQEYSKCVDAFARALEEDRVIVPGVSYPYGNQVSLSFEVFKASEAFGFRYGFTMERAFNRSLHHPFTFARIDTNDAPGGKSPLFNFLEGNIEILHSSLEEKRKTYVAD